MAGMRETMRSYDKGQRIFQKKLQEQHNLYFSKFISLINF